MNKNVKLVYVNQFDENGHVDINKPKKLEYRLVSTDDLKLPTFVFNTEEDAELAVAIAKSLIAYGKDYWSELHTAVEYVSRVLNIENGWK